MDLFKKNIKIFKFLGCFSGVYVLGLFLYRTYLNSCKSIDHITKFVASVVLQFLNYINTNFKSIQLDNQSISVYIDYKVIVKIIEGCNSVSIIVLFLAFIVSFRKDLRSTFFYCILGSTLIFILNIFRISFITYGVYLYPVYSKVLHDIFFPIIIYGVVLILWIFWIKSFIEHDEK